MIKIRPNMFETNSSSTHSLVYARNEAARDYVKATLGEEGVKKYDEMFPGDDQWYTPDEIIQSLVDLGATWDAKNRILDLTTLPPETYELFGYPDNNDCGYKVGPAYKFLLVIAMRDDLGYRYGYYDDDDDDDTLTKIKQDLGINKIKIPEGLYGVNHQCCDELRYRILDNGLIPTIRRKNIILYIGHD